MPLLRSNQLSAAFQLNEILSHAQRELVEYETIIARLQGMIVSLENEKWNIKRQVHLTKSLLAPIRKLPPEILCQIFIEHGVANLIRPESSAVPGLKLASVCSYWRSVAFHTTELWSNINVGREEEGEWRPFHVSLVKTLLELSRTSLLSITLDFREDILDPRHDPSLTRTPPSCLPLLCEHADRWQSLAGECYRTNILDALSPVEGRLHNLDTFRLRCPFECCSSILKGASKLHTMTTSGSNIWTKQTSIPWNQIVHSEIRFLRFPEILRSLAKMPDLRTLFIHRFPFPHFATEDLSRNYNYEQIHHSNLTVLDIALWKPVDVLHMTKLFELLDLTGLKSLSITSIFRDQSWQLGCFHEDVAHWSAQQLPSFLLRSSTITTFTLQRIWVSTNDLILILQRMPFLSSFLMSDPNLDNSKESLPSMLNDDFLLSISGHGYQDRPPFLTRLTSLSLDWLVHDSFSTRVFVDVILSRWKPPIEDEVACIRTVRLSIRKGCIDSAVVHPLTILGLDIVIKDKDGDVLARSQIQD